MNEKIPKGLYTSEEVKKLPTETLRKQIEKTRAFMTGTYTKAIRVGNIMKL